MKNLIKLFVLLLIFSIILSCEKDTDDIDLPIVKGEIIDTLEYEGIERSYMVYVPQSYDGKEALPVLYYFHCARDKPSFPDPLEFVRNTWNYDEIAERENFILVAPQSSKFVWEGDGKEYWFWNADKLTDQGRDDVGFVDELMDAISEKYEIDSERQYACGYSRGADFSFSLACDLSEKIAAIAGLAGYMSGPYLEQCDASRPVPVLQIHGTADYYNGDVSNDPPLYGVQPTLDFWIDHNQTNNTPVIDTISIPGQYWQESFKYTDGLQGSRVEHNKIHWGTHSWNIYNGSGEVNAPEEFWSFLSQYDINGKIE